MLRVAVFYAEGLLHFTYHFAEVFIIAERNEQNEQPSAQSANGALDKLIVPLPPLTGQKCIASEAG